MSQEINTKQLIIGALILGILVLVYIYVYSPLNKEITELQAKKNGLNQQLNELLAIDRVALKKQEKELIAFQQGFLREYPYEIKEKFMVIQLFNLFNTSSGILFKGFSLKAPEALAGDYSKPNASMTFDISCMGKYDAVKRFLVRINEFRPRILASNLNMSAQTARPNGGQSPAQNVVTNTANPDIAFSLSLKFLGYNGQNDQKYAVIDPNFTNDIYKYKSNGLKGKYNPFNPASAPSISSVETMLNNLPVER